MIEEKIVALASKYTAETIAIRHHLHAHPELSYQEFETAAFVEAKLNEIGIPNIRMGITGVIGIIEGKNPASRVIALRADMDALPILEETNLPYASIHYKIPVYTI